VSDFLSRLIARSSGEKSSVRPKIAPAFAQSFEAVERVPPGEILRNAPEQVPARSPFPFEPVGQKEQSRRAEQSPNPQAPSNDARPTTEPSIPHDLPLPRAVGPKEELRNEERVQTLRETTDVIPTSALAPEPEVSKQPLVEARTEMRAAAVPHPTQRISKSSEQIAEGAIVPAAPLPPPILPAARFSARNAEQPLDAAKNGKGKEPAIQITIGKIEVRASLESSKPKDKKAPSGVMSLEEYQRQRNRRSAR